MKMRLESVIAATGGKTVVKGEESYLSREIRRVITDSRLLKSGLGNGPSGAESAGEDFSDAAFLAIKGEKFDGNDFIGEAVSKGVALVVAGPYEEKIRAAAGASAGTWIVSCEDTLKAYGNIAKASRAANPELKICGVTGSVGKTTCKEYVLKALSSCVPAQGTKANFNNEVGVPATVLGISDTTRAAVVEMGMRGLGQIAYLADIVRPDVAIITNIGAAHMELLGSMENTRRAKLEIAQGMGPGNTLILNGDDGLLSDTEAVDAILREYGASPSIIRFGMNENDGRRPEVFAGDIEPFVGGVKFKLYIDGAFFADASIGMSGRHNVYAALAAVAAAKTLGFPEDDIREKVLPAIASLTPESIGRQRVAEYGGCMIIDDCYNAGPESVKAQLEVLANLPVGEGGRRVAFLGDMLELGPVSELEHIAVGQKCAALGIDTVVCVGERARDIGFGGARHRSKTEFFFVANSGAAAERAAEFVRRGDAVLVKGSHAMHMEKISDRLKTGA